MDNSSEQSYTCETQDGRMATFGIAPVSHLPNNHDDPDSIVLGMGSIVPRWDVTIQPNRKLLYFVLVDTFPSESDAEFAASALQQAANAWNILNIGLTITSTDNQAAANFNLVYQVPSDPSSRTLARAFFPNEVDQDVIVFARAFQQSNRTILKNIFMHELGHVLGLRHEFAITGDPSKDLDPEGDGAVQFWTANYNSIMSYNFPPTMQDSDKKGVVAFYKLKNGFMVNESPVTDYLPQLRKRI